MMPRLLGFARPRKLRGMAKANDRIEAALQRIACGDSVRKACEAVGMARSTLFDALDSDAIAARYARARAMQADEHHGRIRELAEQVVRGEVGYNEGRVAIDALKWSAAKLHPQVYGDRIEVAARRTVNVTVSLGTPPNTLPTGTLDNFASAAGSPITFDWRG